MSNPALSRASLDEDAARDLLTRLVAYSEGTSPDDPVFGEITVYADQCPGEYDWQINDMLAWGQERGFLTIPGGAEIGFTYYPADGNDGGEGCQLMVTITSGSRDRDLTLCGSFTSLKQLGSGGLGADGALEMFRDAVAETNEILGNLACYANNVARQNAGGRTEQ